MLQLLLAIIYLSFISLGLPDGLLGAGWPAMYPQFGVPVSYAGIISAIISVGTIISSLMSDRLTRRLGTGKVTALSVAATAAALFGFSVSQSFWTLCLWAVPYGLGAGSVDASLNNYVSLHYESRHMSWLHCMWGVGASVGPYVMAWALTGGRGWQMGYRYVALLQVVLTVVLFLSLPLWKGRGGAGEEGESRALTLGEIVAIPGAREVMCTFFGYCTLEQTAALWGSSYLVLHCGMDAERAAGFGCLFFIGMTVGRFLSGFVTMKVSEVAQFEYLIYRRVSDIPHPIVIGVLVLVLQFDHCGRSLSVAGYDGDVGVSLPAGVFTQLFSELPHDLLVLPFGDEYDVNSFSPFKKEDFEMEHGIDISRNE